MFYLRAHKLRNNSKADSWFRSVSWFSEFWQAGVSELYWLAASVHAFLGCYEQLGVCERELGMSRCEDEFKLNE